MKLLLFSDVHCSMPAVERLCQLADQADVLVGAGDFGTMRRGTAETLAPFARLDQPLVVVPGNGESFEELQDAVTWSGGHVLHGDSRDVAGQTFHGFGGGVPVTPFGSWSYDFSEDQAAEGLATCPAGAVLVVHSPPHGVVDRSSRGQHLGSQAIREAVLQSQPALVVCGHIHDSAGQIEMLGQSPVVNAGPDGLLWDLASGTAFFPGD